MTTVWDVISALGTIVATISIISAFVLYRIQKKDEYLTKVRESLQLLSNNIGELDSILNFELAYEMACGLVYGEPSYYSIETLYGICNEAIKDKNHNKDKVIQQIEDALTVFGTAFTGPLATKYGNLISEIKQASTYFYPKYKGLFRFSRASVILMRNIFTNYKKLVLDEETIAKSIVYDHMVKEHTEWVSLPQFKKEFLDHLIQITEYAREKHHQRDIDQLKTLVDLVYSRHIELTTQEWNKLARKSKKVKLAPYGQIKTITGELREAEKCFQSIFSHDDIVSYSSLVQTIENSSK